MTAYACLKLYKFKEALEPLDCLVLSFNMDYVVYLSCTDEHLIPPDTTGTMCLWTLKTAEDNWFMEFMSVGPKMHALKSHSRWKDVVKAKWFSLHYVNQTLDLSF